MRCLGYEALRAPSGPTGKEATRGGNAWVSHFSGVRSADITLVLFLLFSSAMPGSVRSGFAQRDKTCGVDALYQICLFNKLAVHYEDVYAACAPTEDGATMLDLFRSAQTLGCSAVGLRISYKDLLDLESPCIAFVEENHFVAVLGHRKKEVLLGERLGFVRYCGRDEFERMWHGEVLVVSRREDSSKIEAPFDGPRIEFDQRCRDFGVVRRGETVEQEFPFTNIGDEPLVLHAVRTSCGCSAVLTSATEVLPSSRGSIRIEFNSESRRGRQNVYVSVHTNDSYEPTVWLTLSGIVAVDLDCSPRQIDFGKVRRGTDVTRRVALIASSSQRLAVTNLVTGDPSITASTETYRDDGVSDGLDRVIVWAKLNPKEMRLGPFESHVIVSTSLTESPLLLIPAKGEVVGDLDVRPRLMFLGELRRGQSATRTVRIEHSSHQPFDILSFRADIPYLKAGKFPSNRDMFYDLTVECRVPDDACVGTLRGTISIHTSVPGEDVVEIPIVAIINF